MNNETKESFYNECADILNVPHTYHIPYFAYKRPNRWNNRTPGNGRFPGIGCIHMFSETSIHIMLHSPKSVNKYVRSREEALSLLRSISGGDTFM